MTNKERIECLGNLLGARIITNEKARESIETGMGALQYIENMSLQERYAAGIIKKETLIRTMVEELDIPHFSEEESKLYNRIREIIEKITATGQKIEG